MKKILSIALGALLIASCSEDRSPDNPVAGGNIDLSIESSIILTRTSTSEEGSTIKTTFVADDNIGVFASGGASAANVKYTVASDGNSLSSDTPIAFAASGNAVLHAYSPYAEGVVAPGFTFGIKADQKSAENFNASNFMTSTADVAKANPSASLAFTPRLALVYVEMAGSLGATASGVTLSGMKPEIKWTVATDAVETSGEATDVAMHKMGDTPKFMAFVPAQTSTAGNALFAITIGDKRYTYTPATGIEFKSNTVKRFKLTVNDDNTVNIESGVVSGTDWTADGEQTEVASGEIVRERMVLISEEEGSFTGKTLNPITGFQGAVPGWNALSATVSGSAAGTITVNNGNNEVVLQTAAGTWYQRGIVYRTENGKGSTGKYRLQFEVKGDDTTSILVAVMRGQTTDVFTGNCFFGIGPEKTKNYKSESVSTEYATKTIDVDFSVCGSTTTDQTPDFSTGISVLITSALNSTNTTHYIKNVSLIEAE